MDKAKSAPRNCRAQTAAVIGEESRAVWPVYVRLPAPGSKCFWTGYSRSALKEFILPCKANNFRPPVKSIAPKKHKDAGRAGRLIDFESLINYLRQFEQEAA